MQSTWYSSTFRIKLLISLQVKALVACEGCWRGECLQVFLGSFLIQEKDVKVYHNTKANSPCGEFRLHYSKIERLSLCHQNGGIDVVSLAIWCRSRTTAPSNRISLTAWGIVCIWSSSFSSSSILAENSWPVHSRM